MDAPSPSQPIAPLSKAAFHVNAESLREQGLDQLLATTLAGPPGGGDGGPDTGGCSEFSCNLYSPPPPGELPGGGGETTTTEPPPPPPPSKEPS